MSSSSPRRRARGIAPALCLALFAAALPAAAAEIPGLAVQPGQPIDLDAASSEFDRRNNRLVFRQMHIRQGTLSIRADVAEAARLDFENSRWTFRGNVEIDNLGARVRCAEADLDFLGHALRTARLRGEPARFEQDRSEGGRTEGRAALIDYDVAGARVRLDGNAWLSDGANEVTGERITYDLRREFVTAGGGPDGQVRMKINPPERATPVPGPGGESRGRP